jgi:Raf kinase inhibitor-like YbhB/YbcL family protein
MSAMRIPLPALVGLLLVLAGCGDDAAKQPSAEPTAPRTITVTSPAFAEGETIPATYTCRGKGISPALHWSGVPADTTLTVVVDDPDAPGGDYVHWVVEGMLGTVDGFEEGAPPPTAIELRGSGGPGWTAPCPPSGTHHYRFTVYALPADETLSVEGGSVTDFVAVLTHEAVAWGRLTGIVTAD